MCQKTGPTHIFACIFHMLRPNLIIFGIPERQVMTNSATEKLNDMRAQLKWIQTTFFSSRTARRLILPNQTLSSTCRAKSHLYPACDVASKQSRLEPGRICSVGSPAAASVLRWLFKTVEQLKQAIMDEWYALSEKYRSINVHICELYWSFSSSTFTRMLLYVAPA